jgi:hypothetical protein
MSNLVAVRPEMEVAVAKRQTNREAISQDIAQRSQDYAAKATLLSNLLVQAESFFAELPGKFPISTPEEAGGTSLSLERIKSDWRLVLRYKDCAFDNPDDVYTAESKVTESSLWVKAAAAKRLPALYKSYLEVLDGKIDEVEAGLAQLRELPFLDFDAAAEGDADAYGSAPVVEGGFPPDEIPF